MNESPRLIAFCGRAGSGKSYAADYLQARHGYYKVRVAEPLKAMMKALGLSARHTDLDLKREPCDLLGGQTPTHAMQTLGFEWGRQLIHPDIWLNIWREKVINVLANGGRVVTDDVRFANESTATWQLGGKLINIVEGGDVGSYVLDQSHVSEKFQFPYDGVIVNYKDDSLLPQLDLLALSGSVSGGTR